jgi:hypothetical protein
MRIVIEETHMFRAKVVELLVLGGFTPVRKLHLSYRSLLLVLAMCLAPAVRSQTVPSGARVPPYVFSGDQQARPAAATPASARYRFVSIDIPGSSAAYAGGINNAGLVGRALR